MDMLSQIVDMFGDISLNKLHNTENNKIDYDYDEILNLAAHQGDLKNFKIIFIFARDNNLHLDYLEAFWHALWSKTHDTLEIVEFLEDSGLILNRDEVFSALTYSISIGNLDLVEKFSSIFEDYQETTAEHFNDWIAIAINNNFKEIVLFLQEKANMMGINFNYSSDSESEMDYDY